jgi:Tol biopolymer transport system component
LFGHIERVSIADDGIEANGSSEGASLSADGRYIAFASDASNLVNEDANGVVDVFVHDRQTDITQVVSVAPTGVLGNGASGIQVEAGSLTSISANGRFIAFHSFASNLIADDTNEASDAFVYDREMEIMERVSVANDGIAGNGSTLWPVLSADGRMVAFISEASNLVANDNNGVADIFVYDRETGMTERVSVASDGAEANNGSGEQGFPRLSADSRFVTLVSFADNLIPGDTNQKLDVFIHDRQTGETARVSIARDGSQANGDSSHPDISADGRYVTFQSAADNLVLDDSNEVTDVFVYDRQTGNTTRISVASDGTQVGESSGSPTLSADGRWVAFASLADNLVLDDHNGVPDIFVHDRQTGQTMRVSVAYDGSEGNALSIAPALAADGCSIAFASLASNFVQNDANEKWDIFVRDLCD